MLVKLICRKIHGKLRVRIISPGYNNNANCQFPRAIRKDGQTYEVPSECIRVSARSATKFFYSILTKGAIRVIEDNEPEPTRVQQVYANETCCICIDAAPTKVMVPCGHLCLCSGDCLAYFDARKCPMCRCPISQIINADDLD